MRTTRRLSIPRGPGVVIALISVVALVITLWAGSAIAAPGHQTGGATSRAQNVDYLSTSDAQSLNVGIDVLVPASVPAPFGGQPQVQASSGYYSLYWMIPGTPATYLQISGTAGASLPAGSPADLNNELSINASVRGADAIHDVTSIYDDVWWIEGGVLYEVSSLNMTGADSLGLADSLVSLQVPAGGDTGGGSSSADTPASGDQTGTGGDSSGNAGSGNSGNGQASVSVAGTVPSGYQATVVIGGASNATLSASGGTFVDTGSSSYAGLSSQSVEWQSPNTAKDETVTFTLSDPNSGATLASAQIVVSGTGQATNNSQTNGQDQSQSQTPPASDQPAAVPSVPAMNAPAAATTQPPAASQDATTGDNGNAPALATNAPTSDNSAPLTPTPSATTSASLRESGVNALSDGTEGPPPPVYAGDGTGGSYTVTVPVRQHVDQ